MALAAFLALVIAYLLLVRRLGVRDIGMIAAEMVNVVSMIVSTATTATSRSIDSAHGTSRSKDRVGPSSDRSSRVDDHENAELVTANKTPSTASDEKSGYAYRSKESSELTSVHARGDTAEIENRISARSSPTEEVATMERQRVPVAPKESGTGQIENKMELQKASAPQGDTGEGRSLFGVQSNTDQSSEQPNAKLGTAEMGSANDSVTLNPTSPVNSEKEIKQVLLALQKGSTSSGSESEIISFHSHSFDKKSEVQNQSEIPEAEEKEGDTEQEGPRKQLLDKCLPPEDDSSDQDNFREFEGRHQQEVMANYRYNYVEPQGWPDDERAVLGGDDRDKIETDLARDVLLGYLKASMTKWLDKVEGIKRKHGEQKKVPKRPRFRKRAASHNAIWHTGAEGDNKGIPMKAIIEQWKNRLAKGLDEEAEETRRPKRKPRSRSRSCGNILMDTGRTRGVKDSEDARGENIKEVPQDQSISTSARTPEKADAKMAEGTEGQQHNVLITQKAAPADWKPDLQKPAILKETKGSGQMAEPQKVALGSGKPEENKQARMKATPVRAQRRRTEPQERLAKALAEGLLKLHKKALELEKMKKEHARLEMKKEQREREALKNAPLQKEPRKLHAPAIPLGNVGQPQPRVEIGEYRKHKDKDRQHRSPDKPGKGGGIHPEVQKQPVHPGRKQLSPVRGAKHREGTKRRKTVNAEKSAKLSGKRQKSPGRHRIVSPRGSPRALHLHHRHDKKDSRESPKHKHHHHRLSPGRKHADAKAKKSKSGRKADEHRQKRKKASGRKSGKPRGKKLGKVGAHGKVLLEEQKAHSEKALETGIQEHPEQEAKAAKKGYVIPKFQGEQNALEKKPLAALDEKGKVQRKKGDSKSDSDSSPRMAEEEGKVKAHPSAASPGAGPLKEQALLHPQQLANLLRSPPGSLNRKIQEENRSVSKSPSSSKKGERDALRTAKVIVEQNYLEKKSPSKSPVGSRKDEVDHFKMIKENARKNLAVKKNIDVSPASFEAEEISPFKTIKGDMEDRLRKKRARKSPVNSKDKADPFKTAIENKEENLSRKKNVSKSPATSKKEEKPSKKSKKKKRRNKRLRF